MYTAIIHILLQSRHNHARQDKCLIWLSTQVVWVVLRHATFCKQGDFERNSWVMQCELERANWWIATDNAFSCTWIKTWTQWKWEKSMRFRAWREPPLTTPGLCSRSVCEYIGNSIDLCDHHLTAPFSSRLDKSHPGRKPGFCLGFPRNGQELSLVKYLHLTAIDNPSETIMSNPIFMKTLFQQKMVMKSRD